jgi:hypothetical protein
MLGARPECHFSAHCNKRRKKTAPRKQHKEEVRAVPAAQDFVHQVYHQKRTTRNMLPGKAVRFQCCDESPATSPAPTSQHTAVRDF